MLAIFLPQGLPALRREIGESTVEGLTAPVATTKIMDVSGSRRSTLATLFDDTDTVISEWSARDITLPSLSILPGQTLRVTSSQHALDMGDIVRNYGDIVLNGSSSLEVFSYLFNYGDMTLRDDASFLNSAEDMTNFGDMTLRDGARIENKGVMTNYGGNMTLRDDARIENKGFMTNTGDMTLRDDARMENEDTYFYNYGVMTLRDGARIENKQDNSHWFNQGDMTLRDDASFLNDYYVYNGGNIKVEDRAIFENRERGAEDEFVNNWGNLELHDDASLLNYGEVLNNADISLHDIANIENHYNITGDSPVVLKSRDATITNHGEAVNKVGFIAPPSAPPPSAPPPSTPPLDDDDDGADNDDDGPTDDDDDEEDAARLENTPSDRKYDLLDLGAGAAPNKWHLPMMVIGLAVGAAIAAVLAVAAVVPKRKAPVAPFKELDETQEGQGPPKELDADSKSASPPHSIEMAPPL